MSHMSDTVAGQVRVLMEARDAGSARFFGSLTVRCHDLSRETALKDSNITHPSLHNIAFGSTAMLIALP